MSTPAAYTLINPGNGNLAFKIYPFQDNSPFDHLQRLSYYSVIILTDGHGRLSADFSDYGVAGGSLLFFAPYQPFILRSAEDVRGVVLHFHPDFFCIFHHQKEVACNGVLFNNIYQSPVLEVSPADMGGFLDVVDEMKREIPRMEVAQVELLVSYLKIFLIRASRLKMEQVPLPVVGPADLRTTEIAQNLRDAIEMNYRHKHSAGDYADLLHISPKVLARVAKSCYNKTITALISERVIIEAKRELYMSSRTVKEIAYLLGFEDEYYFSRFFKNNADVSPQLFRETVGAARAETGIPPIAAVRIS